MISTEQYFGVHIDSTDITTETKLNVMMLINAVNRMMAVAEEDGVEFKVNPKTKSQVSGETYGGFRPADCPIGALHSSHKEGRAVDLYDPEGKIDAWCMMNSGAGGDLEQCGIYIEHPDATKGWSHWTTKPPGSGRRVFHP